MAWQTMSAVGIESGPTTALHVNREPTGPTLTDNVNKIIMSCCCSVRGLSQLVLISAEMTEMSERLVLDSFNC